MKVRFYYLIDPKILRKLHGLNILRTSSNEYYEDGKPFLYAFTNDKGLAKDFEATRNMALFYKKEIDADVFWNSGEMSEDMHLLTHDYLRMNYSHEMPITLTKSEEWYVKYNCVEMVYELIDQIPKIPLYIFTPKIQESLHAINYDREVLSILTEDTGFHLTNYKWKNQFMLFCKLYGDMLDLRTISERIPKYAKEIPEKYRKESLLS